MYLGAVPPHWFSLPKGGLLLAGDPWCSVIAKQFRDDLKYIIHGHIFYPGHRKAARRGCIPGRVQPCTGGDGPLGASDRISESENSPLTLTLVVQHSMPDVGGPGMGSYCGVLCPSSGLRSRLELQSQRLRLRNSGVRRVRERCVVHSSVYP